MNDMDDTASSMFAGEGEVRALLRAFDWSTSPVGCPSVWPQEIQVLVRQMLNSRFPMWVAWGAGLHMIYNDAYRDILMAKHPWALARPVLEVWAEVVPSCAPMIERAVAGHATPMYVVPFQVLRGPGPELVWFNFALSPVINACNFVSGVMCLISESTMLLGAHSNVSDGTITSRSESTSQKYLM